MRAAAPDLIDGPLIEFFRGPVSAILGSADQLHVPDATRVSGLAALDGRRLRVLIATDARAARANAVVGAAVALLVTDITNYRSIQFKGRVVVGCEERTAGDIALMHRHVEAFCGASAQVGIDPRTAPNLFPDEVVALVLEADTMFDQTPGPHAGRRIEVVR
jgi:hypothetical protein